MNAFLCSVGEPTTDICKQQLEKFGFKVILMDEKEPWADKYLRFLNLADDDCIRIDADVIPNANIKMGLRQIEFHRKYKNLSMAQFKGFDFYKNNIGIIGITFYRKNALDIIKNNLDKIDWRRPEATAWRLPEINKEAYTVEYLVGLHGFFQTKEDLERHKQHKIERKQIGDYDFELAEKILNL